MEREYDFATYNPDKVCYWAKVPDNGIDLETGKQYNQIEYRYHAEPMRVQVLNADGNITTEERIKVSTSKQNQWVGLVTTSDIGNPIISGCATVNGAPLPVDGATIKLKEKAEIRLSKEGIIQVRALGEPSGLTLTDTKGTPFVLNLGNTGKEKWYDVLPGYSLAIGEEHINLKNDVRLYKPQETVAVKGIGGAPRLLQAADLPAQMGRDSSREFLEENIPRLVDLGFIATGLFELKALSVIGRKLTAEILLERAAASTINTLARREATSLATVEVGQALATVTRAGTMTEEAAGAISALEQGTLAGQRSGMPSLISQGISSEAVTATQRSMYKHLGLGGLGIVRQPVEQGLNQTGGLLGNDRLGSQLYFARGIFMGLDITSAAAGGKWAGKLGSAGRTWSKFWGHDEELLKLGLGTGTFLAGTKLLNEKMLLLADGYFLPSTVGEGREEVHLFGRNLRNADREEHQAVAEASWRLRRLEVRAPECKLAEH